MVVRRLAERSARRSRSASRDGGPDLAVARGGWAAVAWLARETTSSR